MFLTVDGRLLACGSNRRNKLALNFSQPGSVDGEAEEVHTIVAVDHPTLRALSVVDVAVGPTHGAVLTASDHVYTFGGNQHGQLGRKIDQATLRTGCPPAIVEAMQDKQIRLVACGDGYTTAVTRDNEVYWWGKREGCEDPSMPALVSLSESIKGGSALLGPGTVVQLCSRLDHTIVVAASRNALGGKPR